MSEPLAPGTPPEPDTPPTTVAGRLEVLHRAGGIAVPVATGILAFAIGGLVVLATGHNPFLAYRDILNGAGLNWIAHPWDTDTAHTAPYNLTQTLLQTTTLILTGLAVAFAFRCGLFNIGGQGQYFMGIFVASWVGTSFVNMTRPAHILLGMTAAALAGAAWAAIAGFLKAAVGAHEVITTIMLNWIAYWIGNYLFQQGGPLQGTANKPLDIPISADIAHSAKLPVFWGDPDLQGLHVGFFVAIAALIVFWAILNRTTLGYEVRAVGYNPDAAAYGGIKVRTNYVRAMAISGAFAGLAGGLDMLGYLFHYGSSDVQASSIGFLGIAVALLGRNTAVGVGIAALLFGALLFGTTHGLQSNVIDPSLAGHLTELIQGLVVLFVGADLLIIALWRSVDGSGGALRSRRRRLPREHLRRPARRRALRSAESDRHLRVRVRRGGVPARDPAGHGPLSRVADPVRDRGRVRRRLRGEPRRASRGMGSSRRRSAGDRSGRARHAFQCRQSRAGLHGEPDRVDARLRDAADLRRDRRHVLRALGRREHRPRGDDADGRLLGDLGRGQDRLLGQRARHRNHLGRAARARARDLRHPPARRPDRRRHGRQLPGARDHWLLLRAALPRQQRPHRRVPDPGRQPGRARATRLLLGGRSAI